MDSPMTQPPDSPLVEQREKLIDWLNAFKADPFSTGADKVDHLLAVLQPLLDERERLREALRIFVHAAYPVAPEINERGYNWSEAYLDQALPIGRAALAESKEPK
jgi:uncharacterized membrane protein YheB (UPF0754 family)